MPNTHPNHKRVDALSHRRINAKKRMEIITILGSQCKQCGFTDNRALNIDHVNGGGTKERLTHGGNYYGAVLKKIKSGNQDYQILCCNCNQIKKQEKEEDTNRIY